MTARDGRCVCSHPREAHEHYRPGSECGFCGPGCHRFRRFSLLDVLWGLRHGVVLLRRYPR
jgi:hypothetical protein